MGGAAAKARRKVQRAHLQDLDGPKSKTTEQGGRAQSKATGRFLNGAKPKETEVAPDTDASLKLRKPKHLKRKLAKAIENGEDEEKERLVRISADWEQKKASYKKKKVPERGNAPRPSVESKGTKRDFSRGVLAQHVPINDNSNMSKPLTKAADFVSSNQCGDTGQVDATDGVIAAETPLRTRGKKRKGRRDTSDAVHEQRMQQLPVKESHDTTNDKLKNRVSGTDNRRCIGRKPVTDFVIGQSYSGTVVYVKPFGVFIDIGCHSDAFCHVSRLQDDYVTDPETLLAPGDSVTGARVVEIDRARKRITVSLQSERRWQDEQASLSAHRERRSKRANVPGRAFPSPSSKSAANKSDSGEMADLAQSAASAATAADANSKRARKMQRRADRRAAAVNTTISQQDAVLQ